MAPMPPRQFPSEKSQIFWSNWVEKFKQSKDDNRWSEYDVAPVARPDIGGTEVAVRDLYLDKSSSIYEAVKLHLDEEAKADWFFELGDNGDFKRGQDTKPIPVDMTEILPEKQPLPVRSRLRYTTQIIGNGPASGYPVYIAMHGGGGVGRPNADKNQTYRDTFDARINENNDLWRSMCTGYRGLLECGVYVSLRGIGDSWDMHFTRAGYVLVEKLIENMALFGVKDDQGQYKAIDSNRVYLMGFSAGGDGVYRLSMHLPQRFAATNMSGGHPGDVRFTNLLNLPTCLQVGEQDNAPGGGARGKTAAESARTMDHLRLDARAWLNDATAPLYINSCYLHTTVPDATSGEPSENWAYLHRHNSWDLFWDWKGTFTSERPLSSVIKNRYAWLQAFDVMAVRGGFLNTECITHTGKGVSTDNIRQTIQVNTCPIDWLNNKKHIRNPIPANIIWDFHTDRIFGKPGNNNDNFIPEVFNNTSGLYQWGSSKNFWGRKQFYWLDIGNTTNIPMPTKDAPFLLPIKVRLNTGENKISIDQLPLKYLRILLRPEMLADANKPVTIIMPNGDVLGPVTLNWDNTDVIWDTMVRNDPNFIFNADIVLKQDGNGKWTAVPTPFPPAAKNP